jgi:hypothetical protein
LPSASSLILTRSLLLASLRTVKQYGEMPPPVLCFPGPHSTAFEARVMSFCALVVVIVLLLLLPLPP